MVWAFMSLSATRIYLITRDYGGSHMNFTGYGILEYSVLIKTE